MFNLLVISNSKLKALKKEKIILDKYGIRISDKSWNLNISQIGLNVLKKELSLKASRHTSITFYKNGEIFFIIGNKSNKNNLFPIKKKYIKNKYNTFLKLISKLHDLGKLTKQFQSNFDNEKKYFIRHEYLTVLIIEYALLKKDNIKISFNEYIKQRVISTSFFIDNTIFKKEAQYNALFIAATHHKTPYKDDDEILNLDYMIIKEDKKDFQDKLKKELEGETQNQVPLYLLKQILILLEEIKDYTFTKKEYFNFKAALIFGDQSASSIELKNRDFVYKKESQKKYPQHAKSKGNKYQTYKEHTALVFKYTKEAYKIYSQHINPFNYIQNHKANIKEISTENKYSWQKESIDFAENNINKSNPTLTFLSASTGAGKTRFAIKLNLLISKKKRFTILNSLRSLTLQSGSAYKKMNFFEKDDINVIIGSKEITNIFNKNEEILTFQENDNFHQHSFFNKSLALNKQSSLFLNSPILISTIDLIIRATDNNKNGYSSSLMRLITSDLIIDEPDSFDSNDQQKIVYLIYLSGLYGINLTISTATIIPALIESYSKAYLLGIKEAKLFSNFNLLFLSDNYNLVKEPTLNIDSFLKNSLEYIKENIRERTKICFIDIFKENSLNNEYLKSNVLNFHKNNNENYNGIEYSLGMLRISKIKDTIKISEELLKIKESIKDNIDLEIVLYHSNFPLLERSFIEKELDQLLDRKHELLKDKKQFKIMTKNKRIIIIVTTSISEVGRDFDFDWMIIDPASARSIFQTTGRAGRHRDLVYNNPAIGILKKNFSLIETQHYKKEIPIYTLPGFETKDNIFKTKEGKRDAENLLKTENLNFLGTTRNIIECREDSLEEKENNLLKTRLLDILNNLDKNIFEGFFINNQISDEFGVFSKFRQGSENDIYYISDLEDYSFSKVLMERKNKKKIVSEIEINEFKDIKGVNEIFSIRDYILYVKKHLEDKEENIIDYFSVSMRKEKNISYYYRLLAGFYIKKESY